METYVPAVLAHLSNPNDPICQIARMLNQFSELHRIYELSIGLQNTEKVDYLYRRKE
jgi:hypothetical protein